VSQKGAKFVGRTRELAILAELLELAQGGRGAAVVLFGEAGVGKTRTAQAFAEEAQAAGARIAWGNCFAAEWSPAFAPWIEAVEPLVATVEPAALRELLGPGAAALANVVPGVREALPRLRPAQLTPEEERFRAYEAFADLLRAVSGDGLVVFLDDAHAADRSSLELLRYLGRGLSSLPILVVATYRDDEVDLDHALTHTLAELERSSPLHRLGLASFDGVESHELVEALAGASVSPQVSAAIHRETGGNPFFAGEVVRALVEDGHDFSAGEPPPGLVPESVRDAVGRRVARLTPETRGVVSVAAAFEGPIGFPELQSLTGLGEETLLECLDEALHAHMLRPVVQSEQYEFAHALVRHTLYEQASPSRRTRLHRRVAAALERVYAAYEDEHAAEIAGQYARSSSLPGAAHGVRYALLAAEQARNAHAATEAAGFLQTARDLAADSAPAIRADILRQLALAQADAQLLDEAEATIEDALAELERARAQPTAIAAFLAEATWALKDAGAPERILIPLVDIGLELVGDARDLTWARLKLVLQPVERGRAGRLRYGRWLGLDRNAVAIARAEGAEMDYARTLSWFDLTPEEVEQQLELVRAWKPGAHKIQALHVLGYGLLYQCGDFGAAESVGKELLAVSRRSGSIFGQANAYLLRAEISVLLGDFANARGDLVSAKKLFARLGPDHRLRSATSNAEEYLLLFVGGDWRPLAEAYGRLATDPSFAWPWLAPIAAAIASVGHARSGATDEADRLLELAITGLQELGLGHPTSLGAFRWAVASAWELERAEWADDLARLARAIPADKARDCSLELARIAALGGGLERARELFAEARAVLEASGERPLRAIVDYDEALALHRARAAGAEVPLAAATEASERLGMAWWHEQALELERRLAAERVYPDGLTRREVEILRLIAQGARNKEIASELVVSVHTVERHLANIYAKIDARNRSEATAYALSANL
jgi:DNA-binding CsgD family transcriptional regulator